MASYAVIDTETTGLTDEDEAIEIAIVTQKGYLDSLMKPSRPISFGAMAAHHIQESDVVGAPDRKVISEIIYQTYYEPDLVMVAHNAEYDKKYVPLWMAELPWICTYRCAKHMFPQAEGFGNQSLRYELELDVSDMPEDAGNLPHRALYDAWVTQALLHKMLKLKTLEELIAMTKEPIILQKVSFGKHHGQQWKDVPLGYLRWARRQDFDEDTLHTIEYHYQRKEI